MIKASQIVKRESSTSSTAYIFAGIPFFRYLTFGIILLWYLVAVKIFTEYKKN